MLNRELLPCAAIKVFSRIFRIDLFNEKVLLIYADNREPESHILVMPECNSGQCWLTSANNVPPGCDEVDSFSQGGKANRSMRIVRQKRFPGPGHSAIDYPVVTALLARKADGADSRNIVLENRRSDVRQIEAMGHDKCGRRIGWRQKFNRC
jgi:hypothetical protein